MKTKGLGRARAEVSSLTPRQLRMLEEVAMNRVYSVDGFMRHKPAGFTTEVELLESDYRSLGALSAARLIDSKYCESAGMTWNISPEASQALNELFHSGHAVRTVPPVDQLWL